MYPFIERVGDFHSAFRVKPKSLIHNLELRTKLLWEEYRELEDAKSKEEELDALTDMLYIAAGTLDQYDPLVFATDSYPTLPIKDLMNQIEFTISYNEFIKLHAALIVSILEESIKRNFDIYGAFEEVHSSNMSKLDDNGKPVLRSDGKILKGPNYRPPRLEKFTVKEVPNDATPEN